MHTDWFIDFFIGFILLVVIISIVDFAYYKSYMMGKNKLKDNFCNTLTSDGQEQNRYY